MELKVEEKFGMLLGQFLNNKCISVVNQKSKECMRIICGSLKLPMHQKKPLRS